MADTYPGGSKYKLPLNAYWPRLGQGAPSFGCRPCRSIFARRVLEPDCGLGAGWTPTGLAALAWARVVHVSQAVACWTRLGGDMALAVVIVHLPARANEGWGSHCPGPNLGKAP